ncbi:SDR family NAD(P)-dependent oxidoreductase [Streptomyces sp. NPDC050625]|uniref:SDR family NAD(P)-dependent oxidoreductase n=1 Tax=Streptomyces sp. NPDC050625 TaxID=3154629 RepID=UPI003448D8E1
MSVKMLEGKTLLVTGAGSGIGAATARLAAQEGALEVVVADRDGEAAAKVCSEINAEVNAQVALAVDMDVSDVAAVNAVVEQVIARHGRLDCAVNNAGISGPRKRLGDYTDEEWRKVVAINLDGLFYCMRAELKAMGEQGVGAIVNIASGAVVEPPPGLAPYAATKSGVVAMTKATAGEYGRKGVRVNAVLPGKTLTPLLTLNFDEAKLAQVMSTAPMGRIGGPEELAEAIVWLCSERSSYVNGAELLVDGGGHAASRIKEGDLDRDDSAAAAGA